MFWKKKPKKITNKKKTSHTQEEFHKKSASDLSAEEVCFWIGSIGFPQYAPKFLENEVSGDILLELTENDMLSIGIKNIHHIETILKEIGKLSIIKQQNVTQNNTNGPDPYGWSVEEVLQYLKSIGFNEYVQTFEENLIDGKVLFDLDDKDLLEMGMDSIGHRKKLLQNCELYLQTLKKNNKSFTPRKHSKNLYEEEESYNNKTTPFNFLDSSHHSKQLTSPPTEWKIQDVSTWLKQLGLDQYKEFFIKHQVDGNTLLSVDRSDLESIGVQSIGHQKKILTEVELMNREFKTKEEPIHKDPSHKETKHQISSKKDEQKPKLPFIAQHTRGSNNSSLDDDDELIISQSEYETSTLGECKVCFEQPIDTVLVSCGHTVCCQSCGETITTCPICQKEIVKVVKTFTA